MTPAQTTRAARPGRRRSAESGTTAAPSTVSPRALLIVVVVMTGVRIMAAWLPGMWTWGINLLRFLDPAWLLLAVLPLVALHPGIGERLGRIFDWVGDRATSFPARGMLVALVIGSAILLALPDRSHFVGDSLLRAGRLRIGSWRPELFPQAMPLDVFFHFTLPTRIAAVLSADPLAVERWKDALECGILAAAAVAMAAALGLRGSASFATIGVAAFSGALPIFGGYSKAFVELTALAGVLAATGIWAIRGGPGLLWATLAFAISIASHRLGLALLPSWVWLMAVVSRREWSRSGARRFGVAGSGILGAAVLAWSLPRILSIARAFDRSHFLPGGGSWLHALTPTLEPLRLLDVANVLLLLCPLLPLLVLTVREIGRPGPHALSLRWLGGLAVIQLIGVALVHPKQGYFRDWDVAAACGVTLSFFLAATLGTALGSARRAGAASSALVLASIAGCLVWLALNASLERSLLRVRAYTSEPPPKSAESLGLSYRYLGLVYQDSNMPEQASQAFQRAAELVPSESNMALWAGNEVARGRLREAQRIYQANAARTSSRDAWLALARCSRDLGDDAETARAARHVLALEPGHAEALRLLEQAER